MPQLVNAKEDLQTEIGSKVFHLNNLLDSIYKYINRFSSSEDLETKRQNLAEIISRLDDCRRACYSIDLDLSNEAIRKIQSAEEYIMQELNR